MARVNIDILTDTHGSETKLDKVKGALGGMEGGADTAKNALGGMFLKMAAGLLTLAAVKKAFDFLSGSITAASDSQETYSKFGTIFNSVLREANKEAGNLADNYGLSETASREMLSATGDLLTGLGMTAKNALDLSVKTQQLAVDLASFTNYSGGAEGASNALTKAMLGEYETLKSLGVSINDKNIKQEMARQGTEKATGAEYLQAKALAILQIAMSQSKNALGDFERTSKDYANQQRILKGGLEDLNVELGKVFLPLMADITRETIEVVSGLKTWAAINQELLGSTGASIRVMGGQLKEIAIDVLSLAGGIGGLSERLTALYMNYTGLRTPQQQLRSDFADATKKAFEWQGSLKYVNVSMEDLKANFQASEKDGGAWAKQIKAADDVAIEFGEALKKGNVKLEDLLPNVNLLKEAFVRLFPPTEKTTGAIFDLTGALKELKIKTKQEVLAEIKNLETTFYAATKSGLLFKDETVKLARELISLKVKAGQEVSPALEKLARDTTSTIAPTKLYGDSIKDLNTVLRLVPPHIETFRAKTQALTGILGSLNYVTSLAPQHMYDTADATGAASYALSLMAQQARITEEDFDIAVGKMKFNASDLSGFAHETGKKIKSSWDTMTDGLKTKWASTFGEMLRGATSLKDGLKGIWDTILTQVTDMIGLMVAKYVVGMFTMKTAAVATSAATVGVGTAAAATAPIVGAAFLAMLAPIAVVAAAIIAVLGVFYLIIKALEKIFGWKGTGVPWVAPPLVPPGKDDNKGTVPLESTGVGPGPGFASGGAFIPSGATPIMVHPRELVDITPLSELRSSGRSRAGMGFDGGGGGGTQAIYLDGQRVGEILASHITQLIRQGKIQIDMQSLIVSEG